MPKAARNPHCRCYDEVMEELLTMRQTFEKKFLRLTNQIVDLRREIRDALKGTTAKSTVGDKRKSHRASDNESENSSTAPARKMRRCKRAAEESEFDALNSEESNQEDEKPLQRRMQQSKSIKKSNVTEDTHLVPISAVKRESAGKRALHDYFGIQPRVLPTRPFNSVEEFEDWNTLFKNDADQRDQLRVELLQGNMDEPDTYIKMIWKNILKDDAAACFSYRGKGKRNKKAIKDYIFTDIFKECFLQRFQHMDEEFFVERTMRFFNYAQDRMQKLSKSNQQRFENIELKASMSDEHNMDDYEEVLAVAREY